MMKQKDKKLLGAADQAQVWEMASTEMEGMIHDLNRQLEMLRARIDDMDRCVRARCHRCMATLYGHDTYMHHHFTCRHTETHKPQLHVSFTSLGSLAANT